MEIQTDIQYVIKETMFFKFLECNKSKPSPDQVLIDDVAKQNIVSE